MQDDTKRDRESTDNKSTDEESDHETSPNVAPDAVKDPNARTGGKPGKAPEGNEVDPGAG